jgi:hypothetical protein
MMTLGQIREQAMTLPELDRVLLGEALLAPDYTGAELAAIERSWQEEAARRLEEVRAGEATLVPLEDVVLRLEKRVGL